MRHGGKTRDHLRYQCREAAQDLYRAQRHLAQLAAIADDRSAYVDQYLPSIMTTLSLLMKAVERFGEGL